VRAESLVQIKKGVRVALGQPESVAADAAKVAQMKPKEREVEPVVKSYRECVVIPAVPVWLLWQALSDSAECCAQSRGQELARRWADAGARGRRAGGQEERWPQGLHAQGGSGGQSGGQWPLFAPLSFICLSSPDLSAATPY
jgi:hypothetical protein